MKDLDDGPDGLNDAAWDAALGAKPRRAPKRRKTNERALEQLIAAARRLSPDLSDARVGFLPSGQVSVILETHSSAEAERLAADLGCRTPVIATDGRSEWLAAERGEYGDSVVLSVTGGHQPVCQCHQRVTGERNS